MKIAIIAVNNANLVANNGKSNVESRSVATLMEQWTMDKKIQDSALTHGAVPENFGVRPNMKTAPSQGRDTVLTQMTRIALPVSHVDLKW